MMLSLKLSKRHLKNPSNMQHIIKNKLIMLLSLNQSTKNMRKLMSNTRKNTNNLNIMSLQSSAIMKQSFNIKTSTKKSRSANNTTKGSSLISNNLLPQEVKK